MQTFLDTIDALERLHRHFLDAVKLELDGRSIHDINNVQALMLFNIGDAQMPVGDLTLRGCYLGSNVSYNVKKLVENGYLASKQSSHDRRSIFVKLTDKGHRLRDCVAEMFHRHEEMLATWITSDDLAATAAALDRLDRFWIRAGDMTQRQESRAA